MKKTIFFILLFTLSLLRKALVPLSKKGRKKEKEKKGKGRKNALVLVHCASLVEKKRRGKGEKKKKGKCLGGVLFVLKPTKAGRGEGREKKKEEGGKKKGNRPRVGRAPSHLAP